MRPVSISLAFALLLLPTVTMAVVEPDYQVVRKLGAVEVRQYAPYTVAEVLVAGPAGAAGSQAFALLAGYISGNNKGARQPDMSAAPAVAATPLRMKMSAPVTQAAVNGGFTVQFVLPRGVTPASAPEPQNPQVRLRGMPAQQVAVIRFSGFWSESNYVEHLGMLMAVLRMANLAWGGEPVYSRYNPPWTLWFLRRNEIWVNLRPHQEVESCGFPIPR